MSKTTLKLLIVSIVALCAVSQAETDYKAQEVLDAIRLGKDSPHAIVTLRVKTGVILPAGSIETADVASNAITGVKLAASTISQRDTNTTTVATQYSASSVGQLLIGQEGGSGRVWRASAAGTNGWDKVIVVR